MGIDNMELLKSVFTTCVLFIKNIVMQRYPVLFHFIFPDCTKKR